MSLNPTDLNKGRHPRKFDTKTLTPKSRQSRTHLVKTNFSLFSFLNNLLAFYRDFSSVRNVITMVMSRGNLSRLHEILCSPDGKISGRQHAT